MDGGVRNTVSYSSWDADCPSAVQSFDSTLGYHVCAISTYPMPHVETSWEPPKPYEAVYDGDYFIERGNREARKATFRAGVLLVAVYAAIYAITKLIG